MSVKWAEKVVKSRMNDETELNFSNFLEFINQRHDFLDQLNRITATGNAQAQQKNACGGAKWS